MQIFVRTSRTSSSNSYPDYPGNLPHNGLPALAQTLPQVYCSVCLFRFESIKHGLPKQENVGWTRNSSSSSETYLWPTDLLPEKYPSTSAAETSRDDDNELHHTGSSNPSWHRQAHHDNRQHQQQSDGSRQHRSKHHRQRSHGSQQHRSKHQQHQMDSSRRHRDQDNWIESSGQV